MRQATFTTWIDVRAAYNADKAGFAIADYQTDPLKDDHNVFVESVSGGKSKLWLIGQPAGAPSIAFALIPHSTTSEAVTLLNQAAVEETADTAVLPVSEKLAALEQEVAALKGLPGGGTIGQGEKGDTGASVDHVSKTAGDSTAGSTDTYTLWGDAGETVSLGTYDVPIPASEDKYVIAGHGTTLATLPQTRKDTTPLVIGDWARLTSTDGTNIAGWYQVTALTPAIVYTYQWGEPEAEAAASNLMTDGDRLNYFGNIDETTRPSLTNGDLTGGAITVSNAANDFAMVLYDAAKGGPFNSHQITFVVDRASWVDGSVFTVRLSDTSNNDLVAVDKTGANVTESHSLASARNTKNAKIDFVSATLTADVMTIVIKTRHLDGAIDPVLRVGTLVDTQAVASKFTFIAAKQEVAAKDYSDTIVGIWSGAFPLTSGHTTLNVGFDITKCDYLLLTLYDDGSDPWTWASRIEKRSIEINPSRIMVDRHGTSHIWARTSGVNPALGQIQFRDAGGVGQNIAEVVGYKRPTLT